MKDKKVLILVVVITVILLFTVGVTYAFFNYNRTGTNNSQLVVGDIYMHYNETNTISLTDVMPGDGYDINNPNSYFEFTINGKNTNTQNDIWYDVILSHGDVPNGKTENNRIPDKYLKFRLVEVIDGSENEIIVDETYININNRRIYVATIPKNTQTEITRIYRLYVVVSENLTIGNTGGAVYSLEEWENAFASVKVNVTGDFNEKVIDLDTLVDKVKATYGEEGGVIAVNTDGELYDANTPTETIREYRYSGVNVNNYVTYNNETWRIIGIFSEELADNTTEEFIKIVRNEVLPAGSMPTSYYIAEQDNTYTITNSSSPQYTYWNNPTTLKSTNYNDWTTAGLMYYLNTVEDDSETPNAGYLSTLSSGAKNLIRETTYYLGNYKWDTDTAITGYESEKSSNIWNGNQTIWRGSVALMYPSDYGYSADSAYWTSILYNWGQAESDGSYAISTSWMYETMTNTQNYYYWFLSPSSLSSSLAQILAPSGMMGIFSVRSNYSGVFPVINLISEAKIFAGDGSESSPYVILES